MGNREGIRKPALNSRGREVYSATQHGSLRNSDVFTAFGQRAEAQKIIQELNERGKRERIDPTLISWIYIALGDKDQAFALARKSPSGASRPNLLAEGRREV